MILAANKERALRRHLAILDEAARLACEALKKVEGHHLQPSPTVRDCSRCHALATVLAEARACLAKVLYAALEAGVPVDDLWQEHNGIGVRINEALQSRADEAMERGEQR